MSDIVKSMAKSGESLFGMVDDFSKFSALRLGGLAGSLLFCALTVLGAQIQIPLPWTPVPMTLQTLFVVASGLFLGSRYGLLSQVFYLAGGLAGAPFFAAVVGTSSLGYIVGFLPSAWLAGKLGQWAQSRGFAALWMAAFLASLPCLFFGATWLKWSLSLTVSQAISLGVTPFVLGDLVKTTLVAAGRALKK